MSGARALGLTICMALAALGAQASPAGADGLPAPVDAGPSEITTPGGAVYSTDIVGGGTEVARTGAGGAVDSTTLPGRFTIPAVTLDGLRAGLAADGSTLALIRPRSTFPQGATTLAILDARRLRLERTVTLWGDFSFDAISPDGRSIYLVHYMSKDPTDYEVRVLDTATAHLLRRPIVDPEEPNEQMQGFPMDRETSPDGRWAYTLYDGGPEGPFVHALDTTGRTAACVELDSLDLRGTIWQIHLAISSDGGALTVTDDEKKAGTIDTATFAVTPKPPSGAATGEAGDGDGFDWPLAGIAGLAGVAMAGALAVLSRRRRRLAST